MKYDEVWWSVQLHRSRAFLMVQKDTTRQWLKSTFSMGESTSLLLLNYQTISYQTTSAYWCLLMLIDAYWCLLMLIDAYWCLLMLIDYCFLICFPDLDVSPKLVQTRQEYGLPKGWEHDIEDEEELPVIPELLLGRKVLHIWRWRYFENCPNLFENCPFLFLCEILEASLRCWARYPRGARSTLRSWDVVSRCLKLFCLRRLRFGYVLSALFARLHCLPPCVSSSCGFTSYTVKSRLHWIYTESTQFKSIQWFCNALTGSGRGGHGSHGGATDSRSSAAKQRERGPACICTWKNIMN